jgi:hypothetical protein
VKRVIRGLPTRLPVGFAFIIATGEGDGLSTPSLEDSCCNSTVLTGEVVLSVSSIKTGKVTAYIQVLQKVIKSHQKYPKFLTTMEKTATA